MKLRLGSTILAFWKPLGVVLGSMLGSFWGRFGAPGRHTQFLRKLAPRHSESTIFEVPGGSKKRPKWFRKQLPAATWLQEHLVGLRGSILDHFGVHFEFPNRSKNDTENKLVFERFLGGQEFVAPGSGKVNLARFGPGGETTEGVN